MKTDLNIAITTAAEARNFLTELFNNNESYHPEDSAHDIIWDGVTVTDEEATKLDELMEAVYNVAEGVFDPCEYLMNLISLEKYF